MEFIAIIYGRKIELPKINFGLVRPLLIKRADSGASAFPRADLLFLDLLWRSTSSNYFGPGWSFSVEWACEHLGKLWNKPADRGFRVYRDFFGDYRGLCPFGGPGADWTIKRFA